MVSFLLAITLSLGWHLSPQMKKDAEQLLTNCAKANLKVRILEGRRSPERQAILVKLGRSQILGSKHLTGNAIDIVVMKDGHDDWEPADYAEVGKIGKALGLIWGGDWETLKDYGHFEEAD